MPEWWENFGLTPVEKAQIEGRDITYIEELLNRLVREGRLEKEQAQTLAEYALDVWEFGATSATAERRRGVLDIQAQQAITGQQRFRRQQEALTQGVIGKQVQGATEQDRARTEALRRERFEEGIPRMKTPQEIYTPFLEGMPDSMKQYYERQLPKLYAEAGGAGAMAKWWEEKYRTPEPEPGGAGEIFLTGTEEEIRDAEAPHLRWEKELKRRKALQDPLTKSLEKYPFRQKWEELDPRTRGFYPSQYRPPTRWLGR